MVVRLLKGPLYDLLINGSEGEFFRGEVKIEGNTPMVQLDIVPSFDIKDDVCPSLTPVQIPISSFHKSGRSAIKSVIIRIQC